MALKYKRTPKTVLSFVGEKLVRGRHKIHPYPAMLHPLLVDFLIKKYANKGDVIFDPFCGSGVTLLQASINNHLSYGFDINPLALLIARVKTGKYQNNILKNEIKDFYQSVVMEKDTNIPNITNINYWYTEEVIEDLGKIRKVLKEKEYKYKDFFVVCFAFICRNQSLTRKGEFKRYRIKEEKIKDIKSNVIGALFAHIEEMAEIFTSSKDVPLQKSYPLLANAENKIDNKIKYDLVITSPPYGDSKTTVAYGEFSSFGLDWVGELNSYGKVDYKIDNESLGKVEKLNPDLTSYQLLTETIRKIKKADEKRANDVLYFFNGYYNSLKNIAKNLASKGRMCFVVGNRIVKGYQIPMDQLTASFMEKLGLHFENIYVREISNKVMPSQNSPSNVVGAKVNTMTNEYVVVFTK